VLADSKLHCTCMRKVIWCFTKVIIVKMHHKGEIKAFMMHFLYASDVEFKRMNQKKKNEWVMIHSYLAFRFRFRIIESKEEK